jgi:large subunit ribosomal protein L10
MPSQQVLQQKSSEVEEIRQLIKKYDVIGIANLQKVRASQLQAFKKNLGDKVFMKVIKNTLMSLALENSKDEVDPQKLSAFLTGSNLYVFTSLNPFRLVLLLEKGKVKTTAKSGDIAAFDVIVPAGNTGQPPGPIISQLNAVGLPTRIESGSVWINKDTLVVRKGEVISERLASVLSKLGIKPVEAGLSLKVVYDNGLIITQKQLQVDVDATKKDIERAFSNAFTLTLGIAYPTKDNAAILLQIAHQKAYALSIGASIITKETIKDLVRKAHMEMLSLSSRMPTIEEKAAVPTEKSEKS